MKKDLGESLGILLFYTNNLVRRESGEPRIEHKSVGVVSKRVKTPDLHTYFG